MFEDPDVLERDARPSETSESVKQLFQRINELAEIASKEQDEANRLKEQAALHEAKANRILQEQLPEIMEEAGIKDITLQDGRQAMISPILNASIPESHATEAFQWLREHDYGYIIKNQLVLRFGKNEDDKAQALREYMKEHGLDAEEKEGVHHSTLKSFIKEQRAKGVNFPEDLFSIFSKNIVKIK